MSDLERRVKLGDITFGVPEDIELVHQPWGFYEFLGVKPDADPDEIKKVY